MGHSTDVGAYPGAPSPYGTFDQGGDIYQWNDAVIGSSRGMRGGTWAGTVSLLASSFRGSGAPPWEGENAVGFRVVSVPEPGATVLAIIASGMVLIRRKR